MTHPNNTPAGARSGGEDQAVKELAAEDQVVEERCWLCLGFTDVANLGPCPACQPDRFAEYLAMLAATARHHHEHHDTEGNAL